MNWPFAITGPALIGFSGGKTSGYQLRKIIDAHGGELPDDVVPVFTNTGWEDEKTFEFIDQCSARWGVKIVWLEYRDAYPGHSFAEVDSKTASRNGEPFNAILEHCERYRRENKGLPGVLPNPVQRICTGELKMKTMARWVRKTWGLKPSQFKVALALRSDEHERVEAAYSRKSNDAGVPVCPLDDAGATKRDVADFWAKQPFTLDLHGYQGNCRFCYMKKRHAIETLLREPGWEHAKWWADWEQRTGQRFRRDRPSYSALIDGRKQLSLYPEPEDSEPVITCEGGYCSD